MTVRELINILIDYEPNETIDFYLGGKDDAELEFKNCAYDYDLAYLEFVRKEKNT